MTGEFEIEETYVDSPVGISVNNEMVRIVWARQSKSSYCAAISESEAHVSLNNDTELEPSHCTALPITGLMHLVTLIDYFMRDDHTQAMLRAAQNIAETKSAVPGVD